MSKLLAKLIISGVYPPAGLILASKATYLPAFPRPLLVSLNLKNSKWKKRLLTLNAFAAADSVIIPIQCEYYALEGLSQLMNTVRLVKLQLNPNIEIEGVLLTMKDNRSNLVSQVSEEIKKYFGTKVYETYIPRNVRLAESPSHGKPIVMYDNKSKGAIAYQNLAKEFLKKQ